MKKLFVSVVFCIALTLLATFAFLSPASLSAQSTYGSIIGTVTDSQGAVVSNATVSITNLGTGETRTTTTDQSGNFSSVNLQPANYKLEVEKNSFKHFVRQPIDLEVNATIRADVALQVGAATETVEVTTQTPLLQTDSGTLSTEVEGTTVEEMPLNGRNSMNLLALAGGVVPQGSTAGSTGMNQGTSGHTNQGGWNNYQIGGTLAGETSQFVDGAPNTTLDGNTVGMVITQDAIQEFNVATSNETADYGRSGGSVVNMATKSGTNRIHGSVYEYFRNTDLNANDYFNKEAEIQQGKPNKPLQWQQNQYGAAVNGPIKRDKAFFMFTWEGYRAETAAPQPSVVPTVNQQNGIIPENYSGGVLVPLTDPGTLTAPGAPAGATGQSTCVITHQPGTASAPGTYTITNLWTPGCGDAMAKTIRGYYPSPTPNFNLSGDNFYTAPVTSDKQNQYNARVDYLLSNKHRLFARYTYWTLGDTGQSLLNDANGWQTANGAADNLSQQAVLGDTYTLSPKSIIDVRLSYLRDWAPGTLPQSLNVSPSKFPGTYFPALASQMTERFIPVYGFSGQFGSYQGIGRSAGYGVDTFNTYALTGSFTHIQGNHSIKAGFDVRLMDDNNIGGGGFSISDGKFNFPGTYTGDPWTDFLLGYQIGTGPNAGSFGLANPVSNYNYYQAYYGTDTWQVNHRLTLTYGLRYELPGGVYEKNNKNTVLLPKQTWTDNGEAVTGELALVDSTLYGSRSAINVKHDLFAPRFGFAYSLDNNTNIRGGYGLSYLAVDTAKGSFAQNSPINVNSTSCGSTYSSGSTYYPNFNQLMYNCFGGNNPLILPPGRSPNFMQALNTVNSPTFNGNKTLSGPVPVQRFPYVQQWNLAFGHQFKGDLMTELSYAGTKGTFMPALGSNFNQLADSYFVGQSSTATSALLANAYCPATGSTILVGQCDRAYPWYGNVSDSLAYNAGTIYHAMLLKLQKRFRSGGTLMANYTWSKIIGNTDSSVGGYLEANDGVNGPPSGGGGIQDYNNPRAERSVLQYDVPQRAVISYVLNLPFGKGQMWGGTASPLVDHIISGWGINGITTFQKGFHVGIADSTINGGPTENADLSNNFGIGTLRPNYTAGCNKVVSGSAVSRLNGWFNTSCFTQPADFAFGNEARVDNNIFSEGIDNFDVSVMKNTSITEGTKLQIKAEVFNTFNRVQFAPPDPSLGATGAGGVSIFGKIFADQNQPRLIQLSMRVNF